MFLRLLLLAVFVILVFIVFVAIMVAPEKCSKEMSEPFTNRYYAHRGLHKIEDGIPENSIKAFDEACKAGYGIELDVRLTSDGRVVVVHDPNLLRMTCADLDVDKTSYEEISKLRLKGTEHHIPLFSEVLECVDGRVPIMVEIKPCEDWLILIQRTMELLAPYRGLYCAESFDPGIVKWLRLNAPVVYRGQLANLPKDYDPKLPAVVKFFVSRCLTNMVAKPHFISYKTGPKPWPVKLTRLMGAKHFVWTSHPKVMDGTPDEDRANNDGVIFEYYTPPTHY